MTCMQSSLTPCSPWVRWPTPANNGNTGSVNSVIEQHCAELVRADLILIFHPNWWGQPPAILKGWVDRVFRLGIAYAYPPGVGPQGVPVGLLRARHALVFNTSNTPPEREAALFGDPLDALWKQCIFGLCGVKSVVRLTASPMSGSTAQQRAGWLEEFRARVEKCATADFAVAADAADSADAVFGAAPWFHIAHGEIGVAQFPLARAIHESRSTTMAPTSVATTTKRRGAHRLSTGVWTR